MDKPIDLFEALSQGPLELRAAAAETPLIIRKDRKLSAIEVLASISQQYFMLYNTIDGGATISQLYYLIDHPDTHPLIYAEAQGLLAWVLAQQGLHLQAQKHFIESLKAYHKLNNKKGAFATCTRHATVMAREGCTGAAQNSIVYAHTLTSNMELDLYHQRVTIWDAAIALRVGNIYKSDDMIQRLLAHSTTQLLDADYSIAQGLHYCCAIEQRRIKDAKRALSAHTESFVSSSPFGEVMLAQIKLAISENAHHRALDILIEYMEKTPLGGASFQNKAIALVIGHTKNKVIDFNQYLSIKNRLPEAPKCQAISDSLVTLPTEHFDFSVHSA